VPRSIVVVVAATVVVAPAATSAGPLALPVGVAAGLVLHEAGHAAALTGIDAALVTAGMRTFVIHRPLAPRRRGIVAGAGPAAAAAAGVLAATAAWLVATPELALAACPLATHAIGLTVATGDGRAACGL
jgi:hypothetical protein